jgi:hypothetical protein
MTTQLSLSYLVAAVYFFRSFDGLPPVEYVEVMGALIPPSYHTTKAPGCGNVIYSPL